MVTLIGEELKRMRAAKNISLAEMARKIGISQRYLQSIIDGTKPGSAGLLFVAYSKVVCMDSDEAQRHTRAIAHRLYDGRLDSEITRAAKSHGIRL